MSTPKKPASESRESESQDAAASTHPRPILAVLGGSFDPPHVAHVLVAAWARASAGAAHVHVVPAYAHPFGKRSAPFPDRVAMCELAFAGLDFVTVDPIEAELARDGERLYTIEVLRVLAERHPSFALRLVIGADILADVHRWHRWDEIERLAPPLVVGRGGYPLPPECPFAMPAISSTEIRARLARGASTDALLSPAVRAHALFRHLYAGMDPSPRVVIVGSGRVARGLLEGTRSAEVRRVSSRVPHDLDADLVVLAVSDGSIADVARAFDPHVAPHVPFVHCAGALGPDALGALSRPRGVMHPLVSFARVDHPPSLDDTVFVIDGDAAACDVAECFARECGARPLRHALHGGAYHAAAALVANGAAGLATVGVALLVRLGLAPDEATRALGALLRTVADNVVHVGVPDALTGPIRRGDADTVARHRAALADDPDVLAAYDAIAPVVLETARHLGLPEERASAIEAALSAPTR
jgi:nicotinate (nicotinamide) nucleotide adenylyltransferase